MKLETVPLASISPDPANTRKHSRRNLDAIKASLRRFGQQKPIVVDAKGVVLAGNGTLAAASELGWTEIQIVRTELAGVDATAFGIADNRTAELAEWDANLGDVLASLKAEDFPLEEIGFNADDLAELAGEPEPSDADAEPQIDKAEELRAKWGVELGQVWQLGDHRLLCGDSTKKEDVERVMDGERADLCFTSPPYNLGKSVALRNGARKGGQSAYNDMSDCGSEWTQMMNRFLENSFIAAKSVAVNVQLLAGNKIALMEIFGRYALKTIDLAVWVKSNPPPAMADGVMTSAFEFVWLLSSEDNPTRRIESASFARGSFSNVFEHATASGHDASVHGAVFSTHVAKHFIGGFSIVASIIYEPFSGSGTTIIACEQLARKCRAIEISPAYVAVAIQRWADATGKEPRKL